MVPIDRAVKNDVVRILAGYQQQYFNTIDKAADTISSIFKLRLHARTGTAFVIQFWQRPLAISL